MTKYVQHISKYIQKIKTIPAGGPGRPGPVLRRPAARPDAGRRLLPPACSTLHADAANFIDLRQENSKLKHISYKVNTSVIPS